MQLRYLTVAIRKLKRNRISTGINILGLSIGLCACITIYVISDYEFSFDNFHPEKDRIFRVMGDVTENTGNKLHFGRVPFGVSESAGELTGVDHIAGIIPYKVSVKIYNGKGTPKQWESVTGPMHFTTTGIAQRGYLQIFKYNFLVGDAATALNAPLNVVLTETRARQYFGNEPLHEIIGRHVVYDDSLLATVSGIVQDWKGNSDLRFTDLISAATLQTDYLKRRINTDEWSEHFMNTWTFVRLSNNTAPANLERQLQLVVKKHAGTGIKLRLWLDPLRNIHFNANVIENSIRTADRSTLYGSMAICFFILVLAVINFINLSTAQFIQRAKEVGVRKALGGSREGLVFQFLMETFLVSVVAVLIACLLVNPVLHSFRGFIPHGLNFNSLDSRVISVLLLAIFVTTLGAGLYPAYLFSSCSPVMTLNGNDPRAGGEKWFLRKGFNVFQFTISLVFIICSIIITQQLAFTRGKDLGFNKDAILNVPAPWSDSLPKISLLATRIRELPGVTNVALQWLPPMTDNGRRMQLKFKSTDEKAIEVGQVAGDENFIPLYQIKLLAGRNLLPTKSVKEFIINRSFLHYLGYQNAADVLGKQLYWNDNPYPVVGVVEDFHAASFHDRIGPLCIINRPDRQHSIAIKLAVGESSTNTTTLSQIERLWKQTYPAGTFTSQFYDQSLALLYQKDEQTAALVNTAMGVTILISCIGLFGLIIFTVEKRAKEISIRKILGAGIHHIFTMLSREFVILVTVAVLIASPVAWYFMQEWLGRFSYRIDVSIWVFLLGGLSFIVVALLTISFHALKAGLANPMKNFRSKS